MGCKMGCLWSKGKRRARGGYLETRPAIPDHQFITQKVIVDTETMQDVGPIGVHYGNGVCSHHYAHRNVERRGCYANGHQLPKCALAVSSTAPSRSETIVEEEALDDEFYDSCGPMVQRVPSGDSLETFQTCISRESRLAQLIQAAHRPKHPLQSRWSVASPRPVPPDLNYESDVFRSCSSTATPVVGTGDAHGNQVIPKVVFFSSDCSVNYTPTTSDVQAPPQEATSTIVGLPAKLPPRRQSSRSAKSGGMPTQDIPMSASRSFANFLGLGQRRQSRGPESSRSPDRSRRPSTDKKTGTSKRSTNPNVPQDYMWLCDLLEKICGNEASALSGRLDGNSENSETTLPLFVVCGSCPAKFISPMQAVLYSVVGRTSTIVDFWWVKPKKGQPDKLEEKTLLRWAKGSNKNEPGGSKRAYKPLADLFTSKGSKQKEEYRFGIESVAGVFRAFIEDSRDSPPGRYYLYLVWQEDYTKNPLASDAYVKGKIAYQRDPHDGLEGWIFLREYCIWNGVMHLDDVEERHQGSVLPSNNALKEIGRLTGYK